MRRLLPVLLLLAPAAGRAADPTDRLLMGSLSSGAYIDARLAQLPYDVLRGYAQTRSAYFFEGDVGIQFLHFDVPLPFCIGCAIRGNRVEAHAMVTQYAGRQTNAEFAAYCTHFILEQFTKGLNQLQLHPFWQTANIVVRFDGR